MKVFASLRMSSGINEVEMITPLDQPMDALDNMTPEETKALEDWEEHFKVFPLFASQTNSRPSTFLWARWSSRDKNQVTKSKCRRLDSIVLIDVYCTTLISMKSHVLILSIDFYNSS